MLTAPLTKKIAINLGAIDMPRDRGLNKIPKPRMGGISIICGFFTSLIFAFIFEPALRSTQVLGLIVGAIIIITLGIFDDISPVKAKIKFLVQLLAALIVVLSGTVISFYNLEFLDSITHFNYFITIIWIVGLTNAVNLIDGIDGLAAGVTSICSMALFLLCLLNGSSLAVIFTAGLCGASLGFLPRNFNPSEIIMGDTGSTFLGYVLAVSSIIGVFKGYALISVLIALLYTPTPPHILPYTNAPPHAFLYLPLHLPMSFLTFIHLPMPFFLCLLVLPYNSFYLFFQLSLLDILNLYH